jgi:hypothetical protein
MPTEQTHPAVGPPSNRAPKKSGTIPQKTAPEAHVQLPFDGQPVSAQHVAAGNAEALQLVDAGASSS